MTILNDLAYTYGIIWIRRRRRHKYDVSLGSLGMLGHHRAFQIHQMDCTWDWHAIVSIIVRGTDNAHIDFSVMIAESIPQSR